jgi:hypothetical protein
MTRLDPIGGDVPFAAGAFAKTDAKKKGAEAPFSIAFLSRVRSPLIPRVPMMPVVPAAVTPAAIVLRVPVVPAAIPPAAAVVPRMPVMPTAIIIRVVVTAAVIVLVPAMAPFVADVIDLLDV